MTKNIFGMIFLISTILLGLVFHDRLTNNKFIAFSIYIVQVASLIGYLNMLDLSKKYKTIFSIFLVASISVFLCILIYFTY